jgi:hypothetical protein
MPSKLPRVRTVILAGLAALSLGGVAVAAEGLSPASAERATTAPLGTPGGQAASGHGQAATSVRGPNAGGATSASAGRSSDHATGPDASGAARHGLCQAWAAGQGDDHGRRADAPAFQALADAAGGADQVAAYCAAETSTSAGHGQRPGAPPTDAGEHAKASPPTTGPPADPGNGHGQGQGGPPTTV